MDTNEIEKITQDQIDDYVKKYATKHHISEQEAREHIIVKQAALYYMKGQPYDINR